MSEQKKYSDLKEFLQKHKTIPEKPFTHTALGQPPHSYPGSYCIDDEELSLFYNLYNKYVFEKSNVVHLTERHKEVSPILIDLDFRHSTKDQKRHYSPEFVVTFLELYVQEIKKLIPTIDDNNLVAFVLEKTTPNYQGGKGVFKDGIHILFPYIVSEPKLQYLLRWNTITNPKIIDLFKTINVINDVDDIFDIAVIERNNWQMYGSTKPNHEAYKLTNIYKNKDEEMKQIHNKFSDKDILKLLSIRHIKDEYLISNSNYSSDFSEQFSNIPKQQQIKKRKKVKHNKKNSPIKKNYLNDEDELSFIRSIVKILSETRAHTFDLWIRLGWCLHNIDHSLLKDWIEFSKKSFKFVEGECENEWKNMDVEGLGLGTLYLWAKEDNMYKYKELVRRNLRKCMLASLSLEPNDIARVVHNLYKNEFVCYSAKKNSWYQFKNHRWTEIDDAIELRIRLSSEVINEYDMLDRHLSDQIAQLTDEDEKDLKRKKKETIGKIIKQLKRTSFKKSVVQECNELFHDHKFEERLDTNLSLIGFENGIYDLEQEEFRDGLPEDYISYSTKINYYDHDEDDDDDIAQVKEFMSQVLPKKSVREYVWTLLGSFIWGKNLNEKFHIWTGCGGNGKSKLIELFEYAFGDYCVKLPVKLLTESRGRAEGANPTLVRTKGKRFACLQEPDKYDEINVGLMKELTGNDTIIARGLHKDPIEFKPQFKLICVCNDLPKVSANDGGTWRRISVVEFISKFVDDPDPNDTYEFKIDDKLDEKLKMWPEAFMYMLIQYFKKYKKYGIKEPNDVKRNTEDYQVESNMFIGFFNERLISVNNATSGGIKLDDIYFVYQDWHKQAYGQNAKCPTRKDLKENLIKKYGKKATSSKNVWMGLGFNENIKNDIIVDDEEEEN